MKSLGDKVLIKEKMLCIRGNRILLDRDLAQLYGVTTKALNQAVKRNIRRFPDDFMFRLTESETRELVTVCDRFKRLKHSVATPAAFTEQGIAMLSSVLSGERAIQVNIAIMRAFVELRKIMNFHKNLVYKLNQLEGKMDKHDAEIRAIFEAIQQLVSIPDKPKRQIGFHKAG